jgi:hypothetical protein
MLSIVSPLSNVHVPAGDATSEASAFHLEHDHEKSSRSGRTQCGIVATSGPSEERRHCEHLLSLLGLNAMAESQMENVTIVPVAVAS